MSIKHPTPPAGLVLPWVSQQLILNALAAGPLAGAQVDLFNGSYTPSLSDDTVSAVVHQVVWPGYTSAFVGAWGSASIGADSVAVITAPTLTWRFNAAAGSVTVGGIFARSASGQLLWEELIPAGNVTLGTTGLILSYIPQVTLTSLYLSVLC